MKRTLLGAVLGITASILSAHGQGWVLLENYNSPATAVTYGAGSGGTPGTGVSTSFKVGVYWAPGIVTVTNDPTGTADPATLGPLTLGTGAGSEVPIVVDGLFESGTPFTMTPLTNGPATLIIVAYNGTTYADSTVRGHSAAFQITPNQAPQIPPSVGNVMSSFAVYSNTIVPPPSGVTILAGPLTNSANGSIYFLLGNSKWTDAEAKAVQLGGHLVTINNSIENDWVVNTFANYGGTPRSLWIGISDAAVEGTFAWSSGEPVTYNLWNLGEPNGSAGGGDDYAYMYGPMPEYPTLLGRWNDINNVTIPGGVEPALNGVVEIPSTNPPPAGVLVLAGPVTNSANGHAYYLLSGNTWTAAEAKAVQLGGHLVTINDSAENTWVADNFANYGGTPRSLWIGINDSVQEGTFAWSSGEPLTYNNWNSGEPNGSAGTGEDYAYMYAPMPEYPSLLGRWNDINNVAIPGGVEPALHGVVEVSSTNSPPATPNCVTPPAGLVSWWRGNSNVTDVIGTNTAVLEGGTGFSLGKVGGAFNLDGADGRIRVPASGSLNIGPGAGYTLEAWINPVNATDGRPIFEWNNTSASAPGLHMWIGNPGVTQPYLGANLYDGLADHGIVTGPGTIASNAMQHVALTYDRGSGVARLFINGVMMKQQTMGTVNARTTEDLYIGARLGSIQPKFFQGIIDEPSVYNRALTTNEIAAIYAAGSEGKCVPTTPVSPVIVAGPITNNGHAYLLLSGSTWPQAEAKAIELGGHLITINDAAENDWVFNTFGLFGGIQRELWIGFNDAAQEGTFVWSSGEPAGYSRWYPGEPNNFDNDDYAHIYAPFKNVGPQWNDINGTYSVDAEGNPFCGVVELASPDLSPVVISGPITNNGHAYLLLSGSTWTEAEAKATNLGGHLVTINDAAENDWVFTNFSSFGGTNRHLWIGLNDEAQEGTFVWSSGEPVGYTFWYPGEPNNYSNDDYAHIWAPDQPDANRRWNDIYIISVDEIGRPFCGVVELAVAAPPLGPTITQHPTNRTVNAGSPTTFAAAATGSLPLAYQWRRNGTNIAGATNINYSIGSVQANHAGLYTLRITNLFGAAVSSNAQLTVASAPAFTQQPTNRTVIAGSPTTFSATVTGTSPLAYQWEFNEATIPNATNSSYSITAVQESQGGNYRVIVTNLYGQAKSLPALLTVLPPPPVPVIYSFAPIKAKVGEAVQLVGTNFSSVAESNIVYFGAVRALVVAASPTNLTVVTPSGATFAPPAVTVAGLSAQANMPFLPTYLGSGAISSSSFAPRVDFTTTTRQATVATGDLDGDGKPDLMVANIDASTVSVYRNISSNGVINATSFAPRISFSTGSSPYAWLADVDGNGKLDILVANNGGGSGNTISILRNTSTPGVLTNSSFAARVNFTTATGPLKIEAGDLDGDGKTDLAVCAGNARVVSILRNIGAPGIINSNSFAPRVDIAATMADRDVKLADLDGDGKLDVIVANFTGGSVSVLRNIATRGSLTTNSFAPRVTLTTGSVYNIAVGDLDGDGKLDLAVDNRPSSIGVLKNLSTPGNLSSNTFAAKVSFPVSGEPYMVAIGDVDGDGKPDLAASIMNSNAVAVLRNTAAPGTINSNSFTARVMFATSTSPRNVVLGDLDADGRPDLAVANLLNSVVSVLKNTVPYAQPPTLVEVTPANLVVNEGQDAVFTATAQGTDPIYYQWLFTGSPLANATNAVLNLTNVQYAQAGLYSVIASNSVGVATSSNAVLMVNRLPIANADATDKLIISPNGSNAVAVLDGSLSSDPDGDALTYAWFLTGETNAFETGVVALATLPVGSNQLTLVVNDGMALGSQAFAVEVITTSEAVDRLMALVQSGSGNTQPLVASLRAALASIDRSHPETAINQLEAFKNKVLAQVAPTDPELANLLLADAQAIIDALNGGAAPATALEITSISQGNNGKPHLKIKGAAGRVHIVETSTDMVNWTKIGVAGCCGGCDYEFDDAQTSAIGARYYRVVSPK